jgi:hypothetical protein
VTSMDRRTVLASLAATLATPLAAGSSPAVAAGSSPPPAKVPLYVHHQCGGLLCLGKQYDDFDDVPEWTWRHRFARKPLGDPFAELDAAAMASARAEFADWNDVDPDDWDEQAFLQWLDEPLSVDDASDELERWMSTVGAPGQAAQLVDLLGVVTPKGFEDGIGIEHFPCFGVWVSEAGLDRLREAVAASGLPIEIVETY